MNKLYYNEEKITRGFKEFILSAFPTIRKTLLNFIPSVIFGMIASESCSSNDIAKKLTEELKWAQEDSIIKRIQRLWKNVRFQGEIFYNKIIVKVLNSYVKKHEDKRVHIIFDHMFSHDNYTVFMFSMRIGTQGIPIYFKCFKGGKNCSDAFKIDVLKEGVKAVYDLFKTKDLKLIFLADRWFSSTELLDYINSLGCIYCVRLKGNINVYENGIKVKAKKLKKHKYKATYHNDVLITDNRYKTNIVISDYSNVKEPWIIVTNGDVKRAIKDYSYRFGGIECLFKNQKSNGFKLEKISNMDIQAFTNMYSLICTCVTYLTILGADFSKNTKCYKNLKLTTHKTYIINKKRIKKRVMSLFKTGMTLFHLALNSPHYIKLSFNFKLYDI